MKILRKLSEEKGSITMTVVAAMLFITSAILIAYFSLSNQSNDQSKKTKQVADSYKVTNSDLVQKYKDVQDNLNEVTTMSITEVKSLGNTMLAKGTNTEVTDELGNNFVVPAGFKVTDDANNVTEGMVIQDESGNEFVWVPVSDEDLTKMYENGDTEYTLLDTNIKTTYKTPSTVLGSETLNRTYPGGFLDPYYREPDILRNYDTEETYRTQAGFGDLTDMTTKLRDDYKDMIESTKKNKGFYIGRYELGKDVNGNVQEKKGTVMNTIIWYDGYIKCKSFSNEKVESRMIWGCQWDQVCRFIQKNQNIDDSTSYGNYNNSSSPDNISGAGTLKPTGFSDYWKANNIYDLAGNCWEWTQEAYYTNSRSVRGGSYHKSGIDFSVYCRSYGEPSGTSSDFSTRPILYLK